MRIKVSRTAARIYLKDNAKDAVRVYHKLKRAGSAPASPERLAEILANVLGHNPADVWDKFMGHLAAKMEAAV